MSDSGVVRFELEFADGMIHRLRGDAAAEHVHRLTTLCQLGVVHGGGVPVTDLPWEAVAPRAVAAPPEAAPVNATEDGRSRLLKQDPLDTLSSEMQRLERENAALKSELGAKNARLSEALDRLAELERIEDHRKTLAR